MHPKLLDVIICPICTGTLIYKEHKVCCSDCSETFLFHHGVLILSDIAKDVVPSNKQLREPGTGTYWRKKNWAFIEKYASKILPDKIVLDVGAGTGYLKPLFKDKVYISEDFYPYINLDFVCDLITPPPSPIRPGSVDVVLLSNVLEHISESEIFLNNIFLSLKQGGLLLITIPFLIKIHQAPYDFVRYTHFELEYLLKKLGFELLMIESVYEPWSLVRSMLLNLYSSIPDKGMRNMLARKIIRGLLRLLSVLRRLASDCQPIGIVQQPSLDSNPFPLGYHIACHRA